MVAKLNQRVDIGGGERACQTGSQTALAADPFIM